MANVTVIGLGKLGACLAAVLSSSGHTVLGVDTSELTVALVDSGVAPVKEPGLQELMDAAPFRAFTDYRKALVGADVAFIVVPTPSRPDGGFDDSLVREAVAMAAQDVPIVVVCSTVMPGTCADIAKSLPKGVELIYSPEFIALGTVIHDMKNPDLVLVGFRPGGEDAAHEVAHILSSISQSEFLFFGMPWTDAELAKIAVNAYVTMKISFANNLAAICEGYEGTNAARISYAIGHDTRIGEKYLKPGTAFGGPCFPRDSRAYRRAATKAGKTAWLAVETDLENVREIVRALDWCPTSGPVAILGLSYKPGTHITEESAGTRLARALLDRGQPVYTYDPEATDTISTDYGETIPLDHVDDANNCAAVCVMTAWPEFAAFDARVPTRDCWGIVPRNALVHVVGEGR